MTQSTLALGLLSALLFGLRHGIDYDHIAAITDITGSQKIQCESMRLGLLYALGHGIVVLALGSLAVVFGQFLPHSLDSIMERIVGITLIILGVYVFYSLLRTPKEKFRIVSRYRLIGQLGLKIKAKLHPELLIDSDEEVKSASAFMIGMIHGIGAETPTQLGLFLFAAGVGGKLFGFIGVLLFVLGVIVTNTVMCWVTSSAFQSSKSKATLYRGLAGVTATYSLIVGVIFVAGASNVLPAM